MVDMPNLDGLDPLEFWERIGRLINGRLYSYNMMNFASFVLRNGELIQVLPPLAHVLELMACTIGDLEGVAVRTLDLAEDAVNLVSGSSAVKRDIKKEIKRIRREVRITSSELPSLCLEADDDPVVLN